MTDKVGGERGTRWKDNAGKGRPENRVGEGVMREKVERFVSRREVYFVRLASSGGEEK